MYKTLFAISIIILTATIQASTESPYMGQQYRDIKSLSQSEISGYLEGKGMGFAKAAELNHYPGPRHVLDLSDKLELSATQLEQTNALFSKMQASAIKLGEQLVQQEKKLDLLFAQGSIKEESLDEILQTIGSIQAKIRFVHLNAHLEQKQLLNRHQVMMYDKLRGYGEKGHSDNSSDDHKHNHSH